jgi:hypothetical protein
MAASLRVEEESGVFSGRLHPHNGYYAGDFSGRPARRADVAVPSLSRWGTPSAPPGSCG